MKKLILIASALTTLNAFAIDVTKTKITCNEDQIVRTYDKYGHPIDEKINTGVITEGVRESWIANNGDEYRYSVMEAVFGNIRPMEHRGIARITIIPQNDGSFIERVDIRWLYLFRDPYRNDKDEQVADSNTVYDLHYRKNGNVKSYFEPAHDGIPEKHYHTVTETEVSPTVKTELTVYPAPEELNDKDGNRIVYEKNNKVCTFEKI